ncbi:MAG: TMEM43 family protein, partial [Planctomycetota bacterium]
MSSDSFTTVTRESWFSRLKNSFLGVLFGILMFLGSFVVLWWNEGRSVHTAQALVELKNSVVTIEADHVEPQNEGKPVHLSGSATTERTLTDDLFGISAQAIKLRRKVEMYQWREEKKEEKRDKVGGSQETVTTYSYSKQWSQQQYNSDAFQQSDTHQNPRSMRVEGEQKVGEPVTVGAFTLSAGLLSQMSNYETLTLAKDWQLPEAEQKSGVIHGHTVYVSQMAGGTPPNPDQPAIGDLRVSWEGVPSGPVSVIAQQTKASFAPWQASSAKGLGTQVERLVNGVRSAPEMV